ncbi:MAG: hypothetical protein NZ933_07015 [Bacteroidia bacterium]|nr:hypothetical protein [Bacteroidia bacterium]
MHFREGVHHKEITRGALWNILGYLLGGAIALTLPILLLKWLGRAQYGLVSYLSLIVSQAYLLNLGMGEVMAQRLTVSYFSGRASEGWQVLRTALGVVWIITLVLSILWLNWGREIICLVFALTVEETRLIYATERWMPLGIWGIQTGVFMNWVPVALRRFQWAAFNAISQAVWQGLFPLVLTGLFSPPSPVVAMQSILLGYALYGLTLWLSGAYLIGFIPFPGSLKGSLSLIRQGLWASLNSLLAIPFAFVERSLVGRWASLSYMGFYSALHYILTKCMTIWTKGAEALFPVFGSQRDTASRQALRLSQAVWFVSITSGVVGFLGWAIFLLGVPWLPIRIGLDEMKMISGMVAAWIGLTPLTPLITFFHSRGLIKTAFWINFSLTATQLALLPLLVREGLLFWALAGGALVAMAVATWVLREGVFTRRLWGSWVIPTYTRLMGGWLVAALLSLTGMNLNFKVLFILTILAILIGLEGRGTMGLHKVSFLRTLGYALKGLCSTAWGGFLRPLRQRATNNR